VTGAGSRVTYRPMGARVVALLGGGCLTAVLLVMWFAFPPQVRAGFKLVEIATLLLFLAAALAALYGIARTRVTYDDTGLRIRNGFREHGLAWTQVADMRLERGMPWLMLRTTDGGRVAVIAVQSSDGPRAVAQLRTMRARAIEAGGLADGQGSATAD